MKLKNAVLSLTAATLLVSPIAAQAGTTASASTGSIATLSGIGQRKSTSVKVKNKAGGEVIIPALLGAAAATAGIVAAASDDDKSSGS
ncbi:hypothetical protein [Novosphingobium gossypii]|uniref:hypothetical protein n=1 Tax=Novosphingobium gossypii TaxID=1604774 RepID=UPI003D1F9C1D